MRKVDPATGKPYPRKRPVNWHFVGSTLAYRRENRRMELAGYVRRVMFNEQLGSDWGKRIVDAVPSTDGRSVFLKIEGGSAPLVVNAQQQLAWEQEQRLANNLPTYATITAMNYHESPARGPFWPF